MPPIAANPPPPKPTSPFARALDEYLNSRPKKSKTPEFLRNIETQYRNGESLDVSAVKTAIVQLERDSSDRTATRRIRKILQPVVSVMTDYSGVVDTLCQADPMPTALLWGCLKAVIQSSSRFLDLYDKISGHLSDLDTHLMVLIEYDDLFGESSAMQELLQASYIDVIRFWRRVEKECTRCVANRMGRALASFSTTKLDQIVASLDKNAQGMSRVIIAVQERRRRGEHEDAAEERRIAGLARDDQKLLLEMQAQELKIRNEERKRARNKDLGSWLSAGQSQVNESNHSHQERKAQSRSPETCTWLLNEELFLSWLDPSQLSPVLWVTAAPGVGKSVLTAYAIEEAQRTCTNTSATCFQYYTFSEEFSALQVFRALAEQLTTQLWEHTGDIPEEIHAVTQKTSTSSKAGDVKHVVKLLLQQMATTYVFFDGLDEECDSGNRWHQLEQVLQFFVELATFEKLPIRIWCTSQPRSCLDKVLQLYPTLHITSDLNNKDIERYLQDQIPQLDDLELDEGYKSLILTDLGSKAGGCFLWASLMLDSIITKAESLKAIQEQINDGLPERYEDYYLEKLRSIEPSNRKLVSVLLACIVYAKRPLRLEELCEATAAMVVDHGEDIDGRGKLIKRRVALCQPLVQMQDIQTNHGTITTCTLSHATVRNFLLRQTAGVVDESQETFTIVPDMMADICLKYLMQARFGDLLKKDGAIFRDNVDEDIDKHHLLPYAAKYWDKHLDVAKSWESFLDPVRRFVLSDQYFTTLQVQSLLVGGQFQFWYNSNDLRAGPQFKRVFPAWLGANCTEPVENDYKLFFSDWGYLLDELTSLDGPHAGEVDRCFFGSLGYDHFMHNGPSRYLNYQVRDDEVTLGSPPARYFDAVDDHGLEMVIFALCDTDIDAPKLEFDCQHWDLSGHAPTLQMSQKITVRLVDTLWLFYDLPPSTKSFGQPPVISLTSDLSMLRIGSQIYTRDISGLYQPCLNIDTSDVFIDELASRHRHVAISTRRELPRAEMEKRGTELADGGRSVTSDPLFQQIARGIILLDEALAASTNPTTTDGSNDASTVVETIASSNSSAPSEGGEDADDVLLEDASKFTHVSRREAIVAEALDDDDELFKSDSNASDNSAEEEWSDGSSDALSDEFEDEDQWNDWGNERLTIEELKLEELGDFATPSTQASAGHGKVPDFDDLDSLASKEEELNGDEVWTAGNGDEIKISGFTFKKEDMGYESDSVPDSIKSGYTLSNYSDDASDDGSDYEEGAAKHLDALIFGETSKEGKQRISLQVHDLSISDDEPAFHFTRYVKRSIFDSPPVFHPSKPLLVWPLGDAEILFADYKANTFFTRMLCCSRFRSCHVFVKTHFSGSGEYVHFAALEAQTKDPKEGEEKGSLLLSLQVSTHRLSVRKTTRSPPRLVFRTTVDLGEVPTLKVSHSPYSLHWTDEVLYLTTRSQTLDVMRIALFPDTTSGKASICSIQKAVYLPRTVDSRTLHFFPTPPPSTRTSTRTKSFQKHKDANFDLAKIVIGSHSAIPSQGLLVPRYQVCPPIGVLLHDERDLGGWKCRAITGTNDVNQRLNNAGGRLQGKFETFDRSEDCDIVPFLY